MYRNLVIIHLESVSSDIFCMGKELFKYCNDICRKSVEFVNYYSTATSTLMAIADLMYGDINKYEKSEELAHLKEEYKSKSLFQELSELGYDTAALIYPKFTWKWDALNLQTIIGKESSCIQTNRSNLFWEELDRKTESSAPFALYLYDWTSLLSSPYKKKNIPEDNWMEIWEAGYKHIDNTVGKVFEILEKKELLNNTTVLLFGDHGDDMWSHGLGNGFTHAIEPYASVTRVPMILYDSRLKPGQEARLFNTLDIKPLLKNILLSDLKEWNNVCPTRKYSFSRNLFVRQKYSDLNKSYSVTDGYYMLLVSPKGMELYLNKYDVFGNFNLLNFFRLTKNGLLKTKWQLNFMQNHHFEYMFQTRVGEIKKEYICLRKELLKEINHICKKADGDLPLSLWFHKIHYSSSSCRDINRQTGREILKKIQKGKQ